MAVKARAAVAATDTDTKARRVSVPVVVDDAETGNETE